MKNLGLLMVVFALTFMVDAVAEAGCGKFVVVKGDVKIERAKDKSIEPARQNSEICAGDVVTAGADSRAKIVMEDKNELNISPDSKIGIEAYENKPAENKKKVILNVMFGKVRSAVKEKYDDKAADGQSNSFQVKTKSAVAGVRGTDFLTGFNPSTNKAEVVTFSGKVDVGAPGAGGTIMNPVSVGAGQKTEAVVGQPPAPPKAVPASELKALNSSSDAAKAEGPADKSVGGDKGSADKEEKKEDKKDGDKAEKKGGGEKKSEGDKQAEGDKGNGEKKSEGEKGNGDKKADGGSKDSGKAEGGGDKKADSGAKESGGKEAGGDKQAGPGGKDSGGDKQAGNGNANGKEAGGKQAGAGGGDKPAAGGPSGDRRPASEGGGTASSPNGGTAGGSAAGGTTAGGTAGGAPAPTTGTAPPPMGGTMPMAGMPPPPPPPPALPLLPELPLLPPLPPTIPKCDACDSAIATGPAKVKINVTIGN